jgi:hypothetical protein
MACTYISGGRKTKEMATREKLKREEESEESKGQGGR